MLMGFGDPVNGYPPRPARGCLSGSSWALSGLSQPAMTPAAAAVHMWVMTTSTLQPTRTAASEAEHGFHVRTAPELVVTDPQKLERALNAVLSLDLGVEAERLVRAEVRDALR